MQSSGHLPTWISSLLDCMGGCFGCFKKPSLITDVDDPSQSLRVHDTNFSDGFWNSSACEMEHSGVRSQRSISSNNASNLDPSCSASEPSEFVNHGLLLWNQTRQQWLESKKPEKEVQRREPEIKWNIIYYSLHGNYKPFPHPVPLPKMVGFLAELWELEGFYE